MGEWTAAFLQTCYQAVQLNNRPVPYFKAFIAGLAAALPVLAGLLLGNFNNGLIASLGGFAFLYVFRMPYAHRAKKISAVIFGLSLCAFLGSLLGGYPFALALMMATIAAVMVFCFGALNIAGPSAIFMVLVFAMTSAMPQTDWLGAAERAGLVAAGGLLSLFFALMGWFADPNKPEREMTSVLYGQLNLLLQAVGTAEFKQRHSMFIQYLNDSSQMLQASQSGWKQSAEFKKLYLLNQRANRIWLILGEECLEAEQPLSAGLLQIFQVIEQSLQNPSKIQPIQCAHSLAESRLEEQFQRILGILQQKDQPDIAVMALKLPISQILIQSLNRHSIVFISASRFALITFISACIAYSFELPRSFWVPLSTVSVLSGMTIVATLHRSLQRAAGTILGIFIAAGLLALSPNEYLIIFYIFFFCMMGEIFIVKNYGLTALFFTPSALIIAVASSGMMDAAAYFAEVRILDVLLGTAIGVAGILLISRDAASKRLEHTMAELIRAQSKLSYVLFNSNEWHEEQLKKSHFYPMKMRWNNLNIIHQTALGEVPKPEKILQKNWELLYELKQLSYLLERVTFSTKRQRLSKKELSDLLLIYEQWSAALELQQPIQDIQMPEIPQFPLVGNQLKRVQSAMMQRDMI